MPQVLRICARRIMTKTLKSETIKTDMEGLKNTGKEAIDSTRSKAADAADSMKEAIKPHEPTMMEKGKEKMKNTRKETIDFTRSKAADAANSVKEAVKPHEPTMMEKGKEKMHNAKDYTCGKMETAKDKMGDACQQVKKATVG